MWHAKQRASISLNCAAMHQIVIRSLFLALVCLVGMLPLAARAADDTSAADVAARVDQLRDLLATDRGAAILDLLGDPRVRQAILQDPGTPPSAPHSAATAGEMMDTTLSRVRLRLWEVGAELGHIPTQLERVRDQTQVLLPGSALLRLVAFLIVFVAGGIAAQFLFLRLARPWRAHFGVLTLETPRQRLSAVCERLVFVILIIAAFAAGSMGTFLLFAWPPLTGSIILGYLLAFLAIRLGKTVTRFFLAPSAERLRLVNVCTDTAWYLAPMGGVAGRRRRHRLADDTDAALAWHGRRGKRRAAAASAVGADRNGRLDRLARSHGAPRHHPLQARSGGAPAAIAGAGVRLAAVRDGRVRAGLDAADPGRDPGHDAHPRAVDLDGRAWSMAGVDTPNHAHMWRSLVAPCRPSSSSWPPWRWCMYGTST